MEASHRAEILHNDQCEVQHQHQEYHHHHHLRVVLTDRCAAPCPLEISVLHRVVEDIVKYGVRSGKTLILRLLGLERREAR